MRLFDRSQTQRWPKREPKSCQNNPHFGRSQTQRWPKNVSKLCKKGPPFWSFPDPALAQNPMKIVHFGTPSGPFPVTLRSKRGPKSSGFRRFPRFFMIFPVQDPRKIEKNARFDQRRVTLRQKTEIVVFGPRFCPKCYPALIKSDPFSTSQNAVCLEIRRKSSILGPLLDRSQ